jgi:histidinol-phosphate/aromatic aminotransferase/cobyric acid decarboxylase-like protein
MSNEPIAELFNARSHNPSFFSVKEKTAFRGDLLDFCIPVNLHFPPAELVEMVHDHLPEILRYYPDYAEVHQEHIADITGLAPETIVPCNGSTEIITHLCQHARGPIVTSVPTFSRWTDLPEELHIPFHSILRLPENNFRLSVDQIVARVREVNARTLVISNPNNPTGAWLTLNEVKELASLLRDLAAVIVDESFIDFSDLKSAASHVSEAPNLIVVKSMGKSLGWHGVRLGYAVAERKTAQKLRAQLPFWNINGLAAYILKCLTSFKSEFVASFTRVAEDRCYMQRRLADFPALTVYPSKANFVFIELPDHLSGRKLRDRLLANHGVMVRECSNKIGSSEQYLRVAVQTPFATDALITALEIELATT